MANSSWSDLFPSATLTNLVAPISDHSPIMLQTVTGVHSFKHRPFRFENKWLKEPELPNIIMKCWGDFGDLNVLDRLLATADSLSLWGKHILEGLKADKRAYEKIIERLQDKIDSDSVNTVTEMKKKLGELLLKEEIFWKQRAKLFWLKEGDLNTRFFHSMASARKKANSILKLKRNDGSWARSAPEINVAVGEYFSQLFSPSCDHLDLQFVVQRIRPIVDRDMNDALTKPFSIEEFKAAIFHMHPDKSPGHDGFNPAFYQKFWATVGNDIFNSCVSWLHNVQFPPGLNSTNIVLISKCVNPSSMKDLRPIALCNVIYKIISKVL